VMLGNAANSALQPLMVIAIGPLAEEVMKVAVPLYIVERRPYLFRSPLQIPLCAVASGLVFASIENLLYLEVYVPQPSTALVFWRWTVCVGLHAGCALLNSLGLSRIWHDVHQRQAPPRLTLGWRFALAATIAHGSYNGVMTLLALAGFTF